MSPRSAVRSPAGGGQGATVESAGAAPAALWTPSRVHIEETELSVTFKAKLEYIYTRLGYIYTVYTYMYTADIPPGSFSD